MLVHNEQASSVEPGVVTNSHSIKLRSYQQEMLEESLKRNIIVAMDTGSGKTHIAIARILAEVERTKEAKLVWFMTPSVALALQQCEVLSSHLPAYRVRSLTGNDGVDKWTDQKLWDATLANVHVVIGTPKVLEDALSHGFVNISRLSLCVFDEAHHCIKKGPMNVIMSKFYWVAKHQQQPVPHILGLTASPVMNNANQSLMTIESNLDAITRTPKANRLELENFVNPPTVSTIVYLRRETGILGGPDPLCEALAAATNSYDFSIDPFVVHLRMQLQLQHQDTKAAKELEMVLEKRKTHCFEQLRALNARASAMADQLGDSAAHWYVSSCLQRFNNGTWPDTSILWDLSKKERKHLGAIFAVIESKLNGLSKQPTLKEPLHVTHKVEQLVRILTAVRASSVRGIIFVEQRVAVTCLGKLLAHIPELSSYRVACFVGTSNSSSKKLNVADLVATKDQHKDLQDFRTGKKNLMIATNVLEEGIDISACNLCICFDPPKTLVSFVQRRGRARQKDSQYFVFVAEDDLKFNSEKWKRLEEEMKQTYMDASREVIDEEEEEEESGTRVYAVASTEALLTLENAKGHLFHFCDLGIHQASNYVDLRPEFEVTQDSSTKLWRASVSLPNFVHPDLRYAESTSDWRTESMAVKDAAFEAYVKLHKGGLVNDHLLPLVKDYGPKVGAHHIDQPSIVSVRRTKSPWKTCFQNLAVTNAVWYTGRITVVQDQRVIVEMIMWSPIPILNDVFLLFWNHTEEYSVKIEADRNKPSHLEAGYLTRLRRTTQILLKSAHARRMPIQDDDFPILFAPSEVQDLQPWLEHVHGVQDAAKFIANNPMREEFGLVRSHWQIGRAFIFHHITNESTTEDSGKSLVVTKFPKRKDFLHRPWDPHVMYTSRQSLSMSECTIDNLPLRYAVFAAFVPSILQKIDMAQVAKDLDSSLLQPIGFERSSLVLEAISAPGAHETADYNRLEFLGDRILKHCTELQLLAQHGNWPESYLSREKDRIVRNKNLAQAALRIGLDEFILADMFMGNKWRPPYLHEYTPERPQAMRNMSTKVLADVVEALIGAAFVDGGLERARACIACFLAEETWQSPAECFEVLTVDLGGCEYYNPELLERLIGHTFQCPTLLLEAVTHCSFPSPRAGLSYERLEFFGDSVLDLIIVPRLFAHPRKLKHYEMHSVHEALVNGLFLGYCCLRYAMDEETFDVVQAGSPPLHTGRARRFASGPAEFAITSSSRSVHLYDFLRGHAQLVPVRAATAAAFAARRDVIEAALTTGMEYPWVDLVALRPPKFFSDLVEAVLGAIFIDSRGDLAACDAFLARLGILQYLQRVLDARVDTRQPKSRVGVLAGDRTVAYTHKRRLKFTAGEDDSDEFVCTVTVGGVNVWTAEGCESRDEAEVTAAWNAARILEAQRVEAAAAGEISQTRDVRAESIGEGAESETRSSGSEFLCTAPRKEIDLS